MACVWNQDAMTRLQTEQSLIGSGLSEIKASQQVLAEAQLTLQVNQGKPQRNSRLAAGC